MENPGIINKKDYQKKFVAGSAVITAVFLLTRLMYYLYYPVIDISADSASYCAIALKMLDMSFPLFDMRTPGYPFLLTFVFLFSKNFILTYVFQSLIALFSALFLYRAICKYYTSAALYFAAAISVFISSTFFLVLEFSVLSESLFVSFIMINCSYLLKSLKEKRNSYWILFSSASALLIIIRPAALFLIPVILVILIYFIFNKYDFRKYLSLLLPLSVIIFSLCTYNYFTLKKFTISPAGDLSFFATTILYMEESPDYPPAINSAIKMTLDSIPKKEKAYVKDPKEIRKLFRIFNDNLFRSWRFVGFVMKEDSALTYMDIQPFLSQITKEAILRYPGVYTKILIANLFQFLNNISDEMKFFNQLSRSYQRIYADNYYVKILEDEYWEQFYSDHNMASEVIDLYNIQVKEHGNFQYITYSDGAVHFQETLLKQVYEIYEKNCNYLFRNIIWIFIFLITFTLNTYMVIRTKFKDPGSFIPFIFGFMFMMNALFISILGTSITRYSYILEFILYFSIPFLIYQIQNFRTQINQTGNK